jgi:hypothetical protein
LESVVLSYLQIAASILILLPFVLSQLGRLAPASRCYGICNLVGSSVLAVDAAIGRQWGFLLLEGVWALVSAASFVHAPRRGRVGSTGSTA